MNAFTESHFFSQENEMEETEKRTAYHDEGGLEPPADLTFEMKEPEKTLQEEEKAEGITEEVEDVVEEVETTEEETPAWLADYVAITEAHLQNLRSLIKYTKTKDETIYKLSNELQKYREDYCAKTFKPIGMAIISFREDCRKSINDIFKYQYDAAKVKKYLDFLVDDYFEMLSNVGIEEGDDGWLFNGKLMKQVEEEKTVTFSNPFGELAETEESADLSAAKVKTAEDLLAYLNQVEEEVKGILARNEVLDKCLKAYIDFSLNVEKDIVKVLVLPAVRTLVAIGSKVKKMAEEYMAEMTEEDCNEKYSVCLEYLVNALEDVLYNGGISIDTDVRDDFDPKKDRLLKTIMTDIESMDRKVAVVHTECYVMNERVIYPSKVDVYKFVQNANQNKGE